MTDNWTIASLRSDIDVQASKLARLIEQDGPEMSDADMRKAYREGVDSVRAALAALT